MFLLLDNARKSKLRSGDIPRNITVCTNQYNFLLRHISCEIERHIDRCRVGYMDGQICRCDDPRKTPHIVCAKDMRTRNIKPELVPIKHLARRDNACTEHRIQHRPQCTDGIRYHGIDACKDALPPRLYRQTVAGNHAKHALPTCRPVCVNRIDKGIGESSPENLPEHAVLRILHTCQCAELCRRCDDGRIVTLYSHIPHDLIHSAPPRARRAHQRQASDSPRGR